MLNQEILRTLGFFFIFTEKNAKWHKFPNDGRNVTSEENMKTKFMHYIVAWHLPRGSKLRWLEDIGGSRVG